MNVVFQKVDMDTALTACLAGVSPSDTFIHVREDANIEYLNNPDFLCIECGGSGETSMNNYDHHSIDNLPSSCMQFLLKTGETNLKKINLSKYVDYVDRAISLKTRIEFPSLSSVFSGLLLCESGASNKLVKGIEMMEKVIALNIDPFSTMPAINAWQHYIMAKKRAYIKPDQLLRKASFFYTITGKKVGFIVNTMIGGTNILYKVGCDIAVLFNPEFGENRIRKYTIASKNIDIFNLLPKLNYFENGWGGRNSIIGSPRNESSILSNQHVTSIIQNNI